MHPRRSFLLGGSLTLLLAACSQPQMQQPAEADPYANGASFPWAYTAPADRLTPLTLTPGENTLQYEPVLAAKNGWGPIEVNRSNGEQAAGDGKTLSINGKTYSRGFGTHAGSELRFSLKGTGATCQRFTTDVGVDDEVGPRGKVVFQVYLDGVKAYDSGVMKGKDPAKRVDLDITGKGELRLVVTDGGNGINYDHADWADPKIYCQAVETPPAGGKSGTLDTTFQQITPDFDVVDAAVQPDGKIVVIGLSRTEGGVYITARYTADGHPDTAFGTNGRILSNLQASTVLVQADGKLLLRGAGEYPKPVDDPAGSRYTVLQRLLPDGRTDPTLDVDGGIAGVFINHGRDRLGAVDVQADGKILLAGSSSGDDLIARFLPNGAPDTSFGNGGRVVTPGSDYSYVSTLEVTANGQILTGSVGSESPEYSGYGGWYVRRYTPNGALDLTFGQAGVALAANTRFTTTLTDLDLQSNGKIVLTGVLPQETCQLERLNESGSDDTSFTMYSVDYRTGFETNVNTAIQKDGKLLTAGCREYRNNDQSDPGRPAIIRTLENGLPDTTFDTDGALTVPDNRKVLVQPDGKILVGLNPIVRVLP